ncbi:MAG: AAA family ATPase [Proteobacteria bacterium]|nr:AAA family ATPase [Pseudomonadota bacterium]
MPNDTPGGDRFRFAPPNPDGHVEPFRYSIVGAFEGKPTPERRWLVPGWIPQGQVTMLSGDGGIGKSLLAQQLMTAAALGRNWLGLSVTPCKTLALFLEDDEDELQRRQEAINLSYECAFTDLENNMAWISMVGVGAELADFSQYDGPQPSGAYHRLVAAAIEFGAGLVVLDSLHDVFSGNEINRYQARWFIRLLQDLAQAIDGAVVLTAHPSLSGLSSGSGTSGSTAWNNAVRSRLYLHRPEGEVAADESERILTRKKSNYARAGESLILNWRDGVFVANPRPEGVLAGMQGRNAERVFLELLEAVTAEGRNVSESSHAGNYAPKLFAKRPSREGFNKADFVKAMEALFTAGKIKVEPYGPPSKNRERLSAVPVSDEGNPF